MQAGGEKQKEREGRVARAKGRGEEEKGGRRKKVDEGGNQMKPKDQFGYDIISYSVVLGIDTYESRD